MRQIPIGCNFNWRPKSAGLPGFSGLDFHAALMRRPEIGGFYPLRRWPSMIFRLAPCGLRPVC
jgi:hypothetical protein